MPMGAVARDQGDFSRGSFKPTFEGAVFLWTESDNRATYTDVTDDGVKFCTSSSKCDLDSATGWELSGGVRGRGLSVDLEYNEVAGELQAKNFIDDDGNLTPLNSGMYVDGETTIKKWQLEGGYMLPMLPIELVYKRDSMDTDGYETSWYANDFGLNYFFNKHKAKVQFVLRDESNVNRQQVIMQWQFVF